MPWILFVILIYAACAVNLLAGTSALSGFVRPDALLLLAALAAQSKEADRGTIQAFVSGAVMDFSGGALPGIYATSCVLAAAIVRHFRSETPSDSVVRRCLGLFCIMTLVPAFGLMGEAIHLGVPPRPEWFVMRVLAVSGSSLLFGVVLWTGWKLVQRVLPRRIQAWDVPGGENSSFFLSR